MINILFFDFTSQDSFEKLKDWVKLIEDHGESNSILCMIGNLKQEVRKGVNNRRKAKNGKFNRKMWRVLLKSIRWKGGVQEEGD